jgi:hypothetical protein
MSTANGIGRAERCSSSEVLAFQAIKPDKPGDDHSLRKTGETTKQREKRRRVKACFVRKA